LKARWSMFLLLVCAVGFSFGLYQLFKLRFETGDVYPEYSSLRADPLGTMALCESLERMPGLTVRRDYSANNRLPDGKDTTYLHLAARTEDWEEMPVEVVKEIDGFVAKGGRLAITFFPEPTTSLPRLFRTLSRASVTNSPSAKKPATGPKASPVKKSRKVFKNEEELTVSARDKWGWELANAKLKAGNSGVYEPVTAANQTDLLLPEELEWHSPLIFTNLDASWRTIYARGTNPLVVERQFGAGSIVMATDSYFVSNEAMRKDRHADLLAWMVGPNTRVVFDEAHLGIVESPGVAMLMRQYRLQWLGGGLLLLAGLFIWKNALSFGPPHPEEEQKEYVAGKDAAAGFVNLLRRNIQSKDVLTLCFEEWTKSLLHGNPHLIARVDQAQALLEKENALPASIRKPAETYRQICEILGPSHLS
jgi:hypothetical protein